MQVEGAARGSDAHWVGFSEYAGRWRYRREQWDFTDLFVFEGHFEETGPPSPIPQHTH